ncbi:tetratricopeptide repeat protein, partial [Umezakia ovalisporum]|uniref:tetratricopeptide repeat protein n=1 Tax=Umezakia ovalisporum TaxID=75695 RepID=UPI0039C6CD6E
MCNTNQCDVSNSGKWKQGKQLQTRNYFFEGIEKLEQGQYQGAIADFSEVLKIDPEFFKAYFLRGLARGSLEDYEGAIADY